METTEEVMHQIFGLPFIFFERPSWDKFPGAARTFAADVLNPDGRVVQQPSTHFISNEFSRAFDIRFKNKDEQEDYVYITCYGPAISRIFASIAIVHGDDKGLRFPWKIAPLQVVIVPVSDDEKVVKKAKMLEETVKKIASVEVDLSEKSAGEKFNYWEMKGVPVRIDVGLKDMASKNITVFRRDLNKKEIISEKSLTGYIKKVADECGKNLREQADKLFEGKIKNVKNLEEMKKVIKDGGIARCGFCSVGKDGEKCAGVIEKEIGAEVRGTRLDEKEKPNGECVVCGEEAKEIVYVARSY